MSNRKYAVFDVDGDCDVEKATAAVASSPFVSNGNDGTTGGAVIASTPAAFLLPDGRMIGSKNTMLAEKLEKIGLINLSSHVIFQSIRSFCYDAKFNEYLLALSIINFISVSPANASIKKLPKLEI